MMGKAYMVSYSGGAWESEYTINLFVTTKKTTAKNYVVKFNRILRKWKKHYEQYEEDDIGGRWLKEEHWAKHYEKWDKLYNTNECYWEEIETR